MDNVNVVQLKFDFPKYWTFDIRIDRFRLAAIDYILAEDFFNDITKCLQTLRWAFEYRRDEKIQILGYTLTNGWFSLAFNEIDGYVIGGIVAENLKDIKKELSCLEEALRKENESYYLVGSFDFHSVK